MRKTPTRPSPVAYIGLGLLIAVAFAPLAVRLAAYDIYLGRTINIALFAATCVLFSGAGAYTAVLIVRYFRACRTEDRAEREAREAQLRADREVREAALQAEIERQRAEVDKLNQRVEEVEDKAWWGDPEAQPSAEDTIDLSNVSVLPQRRQPPESKSS